jgi:glycosyltransferase involved in cell wall biosynthesis
MKILYLSPWFSDFIHFQIVNLTKKFNIEYFTYFIKNKTTLIKYPEYSKFWECDILTDAIPQNKFKIIDYWGFPKGFLWDREYKKCYKQIYEDVKNENYDLIHAHCFHPTGMLACTLANNLQIPYIITTHGTDFYNAVPNKNKKIIYPISVINQIKTVIENAKTIIAVSENLSNDLRMFSNTANIVNIENSYNCHIFKSLQRSLTKKTFEIISTGSFTSRKNHILLLKAFKILLPEFPFIKLKLIGCGKLQKTYINYINKNNLANFVEIKDSQYKKDLVNDYNSADLFVLTSLNEPFGIDCIEAMACGLPVVASDTGELKGLIDEDKNGYLFADNKIDDLVLKLKKILNFRENWSYLSHHALCKAESYKFKYEDIFSLYKN